MKVRYIGKGTEKLVPYRKYDIDYSITPRQCWVVVDGYEWTYDNITAFALDWDVIDMGAVRRQHGFEDVMHKLP